MPVVIVDIDGTVALHHNPDGTQRREHYDYSRVGEDLPNQPIIELVGVLCQDGYGVVYLSGREDSCREVTIKWLKHHVYQIPRNLSLNIELYMRATGDHRPHDIVKRELYEAHVLPREVAYALDDRDRCVRLWRSLGLVCLQVAPGNF